MDQALHGSAKQQNKRQQAETDAQEVLPQHEEEFLYCAVTAQYEQKVWSLPN